MIKDLYELLDCSKAFAGDGQQACEISRLGDLLGIVLARKGFAFKKVPTEQDWKDAVKAGNLYPILGLQAFTQDTPDNEVNTSDIGLMQVVRQGRPQGTVTYAKGYCAHKKLYAKKDGMWDIYFLFDKAVFGATSIKQDVIKGFDIQMLGVSTYRFQQGTDLESSTAQYQLRSAEEFNTRGVILTYDKLGFDASQIDGVVETTLKSDEVVAGTELKIKVGGYCNESVLIEGLEERSNWKVDGVEPTSVAYNPSTKEYTLTVATLVAGATVKVELNGVDATDKPYKGYGEFLVKA